MTKLKNQTDLGRQLFSARSKSLKSSSKSTDQDKNFNKDLDELVSGFPHINKHSVIKLLPAHTQTNDVGGINEKAEE